MRNSLRLSLIAAVPVFALMALTPLSASATTYTVSSSMDNTNAANPTESRFGYNMSTTVTVPSTAAPNSPYTITISNTNITASAGLWCDNSGGGHTSCGGANAQGYAQHNGAGPIIHGSGTASASATSGAAGTTDSIKVFTDVWASNGWGCTSFSSCTVNSNVAYVNGPTVSAATPTVNIYFQ